MARLSVLRTSIAYQIETAEFLDRIGNAEQAPAVLAYQATSEEIPRDAGLELIKHGLPGHTSNTCLRQAEH